MIDITCLLTKTYFKAEVTDIEGIIPDVVDEPVVGL